MSGTRTPPPASYGGSRDPHRPVCKLGFEKVIEYVDGPSPYFWIGGYKDGHYASIDAQRLRDFLRETFK